MKFGSREFALSEFEDVWIRESERTDVQLNRS